ncbi:hypothetical protein [Sporosarcina sp. Te-1]|uniref:hypothetical protein n=1 Tax=Sporosarcina sp. Te-1 TaxID=2818390 RepID=UPI001A9F28F5|nr:hypothetical protein [Sporosarcina sp. Te-1]QTD40474.1 hypothetical protein J3U78_17115 [Sporosarcina sp. Te-1]
MKRVFSFVTVLGLAIFGFWGTTLHTSAEVKNSEVELASNSMTVSETRIYGLNDSIPNSIPYDRAGWKGTLYKTIQQSTGDMYIVRYSGTVYCSGSCALPYSTVEE